MSDPTTTAAFDALIRALRAAAIDADGADYDRIAAYKRHLERVSKRYGEGLPLTDRAPKQDAAS